MVPTVQETSVQSGKADHSSGVLLLPSHLFFVRSVALPVGISPEELPSFVELSLEQISPFALSQLYYGYYLPQDGSDLLIFAAYRKQLSPFEDEAWTVAELVLPDFSPVLGLSREGPTLAFLRNDDALTAVYWSAASAVPDRVLSRRIDPDGAGLSPERAREELRRKLGPLPEDVATVLLENPEGSFHDRNLLFDLQQEDEAKGISAEIARPFFLTMDVRDKDFLQATRQIQRQNRWLWSTLLVVCAAFLALGVFEAALFAGVKILERREARIQDLEPDVARIMQEEELALRLEELSGELLLPFEMLTVLNEFRPRSVYYTRFLTDGLRSFTIEALTPQSQDVDRFQRLLEGVDALENVEIRGLRLRANDGRSQFTLSGSFREQSLTNLSAPASEAVELEEPVEEAAELELPEVPIDMPPEVGAEGEAGNGRDPRVRSREPALSPDAEVEKEAAAAVGNEADSEPAVDLPSGETTSEGVEGGVEPPELPVGETPAGTPTRDEAGSDEEESAEEAPLPLPVEPLGDAPAGEADSGETDAGEASLPANEEAEL